ncbi:MAG: acetyl esterase [Mycobacterium sp.]|nr:acetyl esterase [Mycobacterium sp.]
MSTDTTVGVPGHLGRLDPELRGVAAGLDVLQFEHDTLAQERHRLKGMSAVRAAAVDLAGVEVASFAITGASGQQLGLRTYRPASPATLPIVVYAHSGGFVSGDLDTDHGDCVELARTASCLVISVDYRLAPENPCPAALDDVSAAFDYAIANAEELNADPSRVALAGRDAGAALVAGLAQSVFDAEGPRIRLQILHEPMLDRGSTTSRREFQSTPGLSGRAMDHGWAHYLAATPISRYTVPASRPNLEGLAPAFVSCAEIGPCRDEALEYANRLMHAYVHTELHVFAAVFHGFDSAAPDVALSREVRELHARSLRRAFSY